MPAGGEDGILAEMVRAVEAEPDRRLEITVFVGGGLLSGVLVPQSRSLELLELAFKLPTEEAPDASGFLHLKVQRMFFGGREVAIADEYAIWRGRLASIDGWMAGSMVASASPTEAAPR